MRDIGRASLLKKGIHQLKTYSGTTAEYRSGVVIFKLSISEVIPRKRLAKPSSSLGLD